MIKGARRRAFAIVIAIPAFAGCEPHTATEHADLSFAFTCSERGNAALEQKIQDFLTAKKFKVLNQGAIQRAHGAMIYDLQITAIDDRNRIIDVVAFPSTAGRQNIELYSPPPTVRDEPLEDALIKFASVELGCAVANVSHNSNDISARELHDWNVRRIQGLFDEAATMSSAQPQG